MAGEDDPTTSERPSFFVASRSAEVGKVTILLTFANLPKGRHD
jgi:hypothetical protein